MVSKANQDGAERDWQRITEEFRSESDRAAALVAAALLDANLEELLRALMVPDQHEVERLLGSGLRTFGARIRACYCLGLASADECHDLRVIQDVRNYFAHNLHVAFDDPYIAKACGSFRLILRMVLDGVLPDHRHALEQTTCILSVMLVDRIRRTRGRRRTRRPEIDLQGLAEGRCPLILDDEDEDMVDES